jgi:hypothetical protein
MFQYFFLKPYINTYCNYPLVLLYNLGSSKSLGKFYSLFNLTLEELYLIHKIHSIQVVSIRGFKKNKTNIDKKEIKTKKNAKNFYFNYFPKIN